MKKNTAILDLEECVRLKNKETEIEDFFDSLDSDEICVIYGRYKRYEFISRDDAFIKMEKINKDLIKNNDELLKEIENIKKMSIFKFMKWRRNKIILKT